MLTLKTMGDFKMHLEVDLDMVIIDNTINKINFMMMKNRMRSKDINTYCFAK